MSETPVPPEQKDRDEVLLIETDQPGVSLVKMRTHEDDEEYFVFQNKNMKRLAAFGNAIDPTTQAVTYRRTQNRGGRFGIRKDGTLIGVVGYKPSFDDKEAEIYIALDTEASGRGYATSAVTAITVCIAPQYERVFANIHPANEDSIRLFERAGYVRQEGLQQYDWGPAVVFELETSKQ